MQQEQPQYYRAVPVSEKPKQPDLYHTLIEHEKLGIEGLPCHNNYIGDSNGGYWEIDGDSKVTHYLEPIPIPDAAVLRSKMQEVADLLWDKPNHSAVEEAYTIAREALSAVGYWWKDASQMLAEHFVAHCDRLLRDKGASNKEVLDCIELAANDIVKDFKITMIWED